MMPTWPSQNTRSPRRSASARAPVEGAAELCRLHVGVARGVMARRFQRQAAPGPSSRARCWCDRPTDRACRETPRPPRRNRVRPCRRRRMAGEHIAAAGKGEELALGPCDGDARVQAEQRERRGLAVRLRVDVSAQHRDAMRRRRRHRGQSLARHVADIAVAGELHPGPALALVVEGHGLAEQSLGVERGVETRLAAQRQGRRADLARLTLGIASGLDQPTQATLPPGPSGKRGGAGQADTSLLTRFRALGGRNGRARAPPAARRLSDVPAGRAAPSRKCRDERNVWRRGRSAGETERR